MPRGVYQRGPVEGQTEVVEEAALSPRAAEVRRDRRRRDDGDIDRMARQKLAIPRNIQAQAEAEGKVFRWVLDEPGRMMDVHENDWDAVEGVAAVSAGQQEDTKLVLMWKFKDWNVKDELRDEAHLAELESSLIAGPSSADQAKGIVKPEGQVNRISRKQGL